MLVQSVLNIKEAEARKNKVSQVLLLVKSVLNAKKAAAEKAAAEKAAAEKAAAEKAAMGSKNK